MMAGMFRGGGQMGPGHGMTGMGLDSPEENVRLDRKVLSRLLSFVRPYRGRFVLAVALMLTASAAGLAGPYLLKLAIDRSIAQRDITGLHVIALLFLGTSLVQWWASYGQTFLMTWIGQHIIHDLRQRLFTHLQTLGFRFFDRMASGRIMSRVTSDVDAMNQFVSTGLTSLVNDTFSIAAILGTMLYLSWKLSLVAFVVLPLLALFIYWFRHRMRATFMEVRRKLADMTANLAESISGVRVTQSFTRESENMARFEEINEENRQANVQAAGVESLFMPVIEITAALGTALILAWGGYLIRSGDPTVTIGDVAAFLTYLTRLFLPVRDLSQLYNIFQHAAVSSERIFELFDQRPDVTDAPGAQPLPPVSGRVRFEDVHFAYHKNQPVLKGVHIEAAPGETIALVGPTGAGKSSIINLLARFYDPDAGRITVDGHDLRQVQVRSWRQQLGIVLQDTFIFSGTVRENIRFGRPTASDADVEEAARAVGAHDFILRLPDGYETEVNERGGRLSVGQRQLVAFARALVVDPRILILDEATSSVDAYTEVLIVKALERLLHGRTSFVIAHRLSTIRRADRIYFIDDGRVVEAGSHAELLAQQGRYHDLYMQQFKAAAAMAGGN